ncbi:MAG TPA: hypothetical protein VKH35_17495 [Thermoanaerobaculia bacterium]|nr:hypothetical protein [Thermoanaerobaculia bacterium]
MGRKARQFRIEQERAAHPPKPKQPRRPRRDTPVDTSKPGVSATDRRAGRGATAERNRSTHAGRKEGVKLENSESGTPSRKSTRKSQGRIKRTGNFHLRAVEKTRTRRKVTHGRAEAGKPPVNRRRR